MASAGDASARRFKPPSGKPSPGGRTIHNRKLARHRRNAILDKIEDQLSEDRLRTHAATAKPLREIVRLAEKLSARCRRQLCFLEVSARQDCP